MKRLINALIAAVVVIVLLFLGYWFFLRPDSSFKKSADMSEYSAVALMSNELFFGRIASDDGKQIVLEDVYFFTFVNDPAASPTPKTTTESSNQNLKPTLIDTNASDSLAPTSTYVINKDQIKYSYPLTEESQVVKTIEEYKKK